MELMAFGEILNVIKDVGGWAALVYLLWLFVEGRVMSSVQVEELRALLQELRGLSMTLKTYIEQQETQRVILEQSLQDMCEQVERHNVWRDRVNLLTTRMADAYERLAELVGAPPHNGKRIRENLADTGG